MTTLNNTTMTIRINSDIKNQAQDLFSELGLDMSTAVNAFFRQSIREQGLPFELTTDEAKCNKNHTPNRKTRKVLRDSAKGKHLSRVFASVEELMEDLNS